MKLKNLFTPNTDDVRNPFASLDSEVCCGKHEFCQKELILKAFQNPVEYYDDEELDIFQNRPAESYTEQETEQFAEILHTMMETDVPGWLNSLKLRGIELPDPVKEEIRFLFNE
jgi:hypothetical protein